MLAIPRAHCLALGLTARMVARVALTDNGLTIDFYDRSSPNGRPAVRRHSARETPRPG